MTDVITVATDPHEGLDRLQDSLSLMGAALTIVGTGELFHGYCWRFKQLVIAARESKADIIIHCDGYDTVCLGSVDQLAEAFMMDKRPILFSAEWNERTEEQFWLNPALLVARRQAFCDYFSDRLLDDLFPDHFNDMFQLQFLYAHDPGAFAIDLANDYFFTQVAQSQQLTQVAGKLEVGGKTPFFVHGPQQADLSNVDAWLDAEVPLLDRATGAATPL